MAESERMAALKKAYADMILNTAKAAAERVLESEKKARRFQHDLAAAKEESIGLLLRLKQIIDAKESEILRTTSSQKSKIDVLESQLQEAESVIIDLRTELRGMRHKLEKVKNNNDIPLSDTNMKENELSDQNAVPEPIMLVPSKPGLQTVMSLTNKTLLDHNLNNRCCSPQELKLQTTSCHFENCSHRNMEISSAIMGKNEPELFGNGCTQRIHASEGNLVAGKLPSPGGVDQSSSTENVLMSKATNIRDVERMKNCSRNIDEESKSNSSSFRNKNAERMKNFSSQEVRNHVIKTQFGKTKTRSYPIQPIKPYQAPAILSRHKTYMGNGNAKSHECSHAPSSTETHSFDTKKNSGESKEILSKNDHSVSEQLIVQEAKRQKKVQGVDATSSSFIFNPDQLSKVCQPSFHPTRCNSYSFLLHGNGNSSEDCSKTNEKVNLKPLPRLDPGLTLISGGDSISGSKKVKMLYGSCILQNAAKKDGERKKAESCAASQNSADRHDDSNPEMVAVPVQCTVSKCNQESKETTANALAECSESEGSELDKESNILSPSQAEKSRPIKYTFHRRRKKEALSSIDENTSWDKNKVNMTLGEKQNYSPPLQKKSSMLNESSREKQRLAQVARQLISLSEKRWQ